MRLIDADKMNPMRCPQSIKEMREWIDRQPTAYSVEAVVRELEKSTNGCGEIPLEDAIEIVRGGRNE